MAVSTCEECIQVQNGGTKTAAAEGEDAIKAERQFYAAIIGQPRLLAFQYILNQPMPFLLLTQLCDMMVNSLKQLKNNK